MAKRDLAAELLRELGQDRTQYHSGEELSARLGVSRTAVWKAACRLREQGYAIESVTRLGYRLTALPDGMTKELLEQYLPQGRGETVICYEETDSTNTRGMQLALEGAPTGTVVLADRQTHGNGRLGRSFASPAGQGVYLSYLLRPDFDPAALSLLTSCAGHLLPRWPCGIRRIFRRFGHPRGTGGNRPYHSGSHSLWRQAVPTGGWCPLCGAAIPCHPLHWYAYFLLGR